MNLLKVQRRQLLVHGVNGKLILKPITANQRKLVDSTEKNDMVFAIGPAGTGKDLHRSGTWR